MTSPGSEARKRPCLICRAVEDHPVHSQWAKRGGQRIMGQRVAMVNKVRYFVHDYDPGERRRDGR